MDIEEIKKMDAVRAKAQEMLDLMFPGTDYKLTVTIGRRDWAYDHRTLEYILGRDLRCYEDQIRDPHHHNIPAGFGSSEIAQAKPHKRDPLLGRETEVRHSTNKARRK